MPSIDEESDSINIDLIEISEQQMLEHVFGFGTVKKTRTDKFSVSTADSGIDTELDNDVSKSLQPQTGLYISHQAAENMHSDATDPGETKQLSSQEGSSNLNDSQTACKPPNSSLSQSDDNNSTLLSKFYNGLVKQNSNDVEPVVSSANGLCPSSIKEGSNNNQTVPSNNKITNQSSSYATAVEEGANKPLFHSVNNNDSTTSISYIMPSSSENDSQPLLHSTSTGITTTAKYGSYIDHYAASNTDQPSLHPTHSDTVTPAKDGSYVDHCAAPNTDELLSHPTHNNVALTGSYIDRYALSDAKHTSPYAKPVVDEDHVNNYTAPNIDHPTSQPTCDGTVSNGSYIGCYTASDASSGYHVDHNGKSNNNHPTYPTHNDAVSIGSYIHNSATGATQPLKIKTAKHENHTEHNATSNTAHPILKPAYNDTISTGCYIDCHGSSNATQLSLPCNKIATAKDGSYIDRHATSHTSQPLSHPAHPNTITPTKNGSYVDHCAAHCIRCN